MKILTGLLMLLFSSVVVAQTDITPQVTAALKKGDAAALSGYMMSTVDITLNDQENNYTKEEAQKALMNFFKDHTVSNFAVKHQGTSKLDDQYRIGDLQTSKGLFRVTFFMKKNGATMLIRQLKIEPAQ